MSDGDTLRWEQRAVSAAVLIKENRIAILLSNHVEKEFLEHDPPAESVSVWVCSPLKGFSALQKSKWDTDLKSCLPQRARIPVALHSKLLLLSNGDLAVPFHSNQSSEWHQSVAIYRILDAKLNLQQVHSLDTLPFHAFANSPSVQLVFALCGC